MTQLRLYPPPAANRRPVPEALRREVLERVVDLLVAVTPTETGTSGESAQATERLTWSTTEGASSRGESCAEISSIECTAATGRTSPTANTIRSWTTTLRSTRWGRTANPGHRPSASRTRSPERTPARFAAVFTAMSGASA